MCKGDHTQGLTHTHSHACTLTSTPTPVVTYGHVAHSHMAHTRVCAHVCIPPCSHARTRTCSHCHTSTPIPVVTHGHVCTLTHGAHACAHTCTYHHTHTLAHARAHILSHKHTHTCGHTRARVHTMLTRLHTHTLTYCHTSTPILTRPHTGAHTCTHAHLHAHTHSCTPTSTHAPARTVTPPRAHPYVHTHARRHTSTHRGIHTKAGPLPGEGSPRSRPASLRHWAIMRTTVPHGRLAGGVPSRATEGRVAADHSITLHPCPEQIGSHPEGRRVPWMTPPCDRKPRSRPVRLLPEVPQHVRGLCLQVVGPLPHRREHNGPPFPIWGAFGM